MTEDRAEEAPERTAAVVVPVPSQQHVLCTVITSPSSPFLPYSHSHTMPTPPTKLSVRATHASSLALSFSHCSPLITASETKHQPPRHRQLSSTDRHAQRVTENESGGEMPLFFSRLPFNRAGSRVDPQPAPSPQYLATNIVQGNDCGNITAAPLIFPRYLDSRDVSACVFSLTPVDSRWVDAVLRQLCVRRHSALAQPPQSRSADAAACDGRAEKCTRGGAEGDGGFVSACVATKSRRLSRRSSSAYVQCAMASPSPSRTDGDSNRYPAAASVWACGLRLVWRETSLDPLPSGTVSTVAAGRVAEDQDTTAYPTHFRATAILDDNAGDVDAVTADACDSAAGPRSCANAEPCTPLAYTPCRTHVGDGDLLTGLEADTEELVRRWWKPLQQPAGEVEESEGGGRRGNTLSLLLSSVSPQQRRPLVEVKVNANYECPAGQAAPLQHMDDDADKGRRAVHAPHDVPYACTRSLVGVPDALVLEPGSPCVVDVPLSSLLPWSQRPRKRTRASLEAEATAGLTVPSCHLTTKADGTAQVPQAAPDLCRCAAHWPHLCSSATPKTPSHAVRVISVSGSLPQRHLVEMESLWRFSSTARSIPYVLRMPLDVGAKARWSVMMEPTTWLERKTGGGHNGELSVGGVRHTAGAEVALREAAASAQPGGTVVTAPEPALVRHVRLRFLVRKSNSDCGGAGQQRCRAASVAPPASSMTFIEGSRTAEALSAEWGAFVANVHESRIAVEQQRAASTRERCQAAAASLRNVSESVADTLASLPQLHFSRLCVARRASHREGSKRTHSVLDAGPKDSMYGLGHAYPYPVLQWWRWTSCSRSRAPLSLRGQETPHRLPETCTAFSSVPDGAEATREQLAVTLLRWVHDMSDVRWRAASWLPWDSWIAVACAVAGVPLLLFPLSPTHASLLMPSASRVQGYLRIAAAEDAGAARAAHLTADSLVLGGRPAGHSTGGPVLERHPWSAPAAAPQLLSEAMASTPARPGGVLSAVAQEDASHAHAHHWAVRAAAVTECEALARACDRHAGTLSQEREGVASATATAAHAPHRSSLMHRRCGKADAVWTSDGGHSWSMRTAAAAQVSASSPNAASPLLPVVVFPSSPAVVYVARGHVDSAAADLLGEDSRFPPSTVALLAPSESPSISKASSVDDATTGDLHFSEAVGRKRPRSAVTSPSATVLPFGPANVTPSLTYAVRASSSRAGRDASLPSPCDARIAQRSSTPQRLLAAWFEQRCREVSPAADDSPSLAALAATTETDAVPSSGEGTLLGPQASPHLPSPPPSDTSSATYFCLGSHRLQRLLRWLIVPPSPTRLPFAPPRQRRRCVDLICESAGPTTLTTHAPVSQPPSRWGPCTRQALLQDAQPPGPRCTLASPTISSAQVREERRTDAATRDAAAGPTACAEGALWSPTGELATVAPTGGNGCTALSMCLPAKPLNGLEGTPMSSVPVWRWAQLTLHNYAADALTGAALSGAGTVKLSPRATDATVIPTVRTVPPAAVQTAVHRFAPVVKSAVTSALTHDCPLRRLPSCSSALQGQPPTTKTTGECLLITAEHWRQHRARRAAQRLALYGLLLAHDARPAPSVPLRSRPLSHSINDEETGLSRGADHTAADAFIIGAQLYRDELERNDKAELVQCVRDALVRAQYTACVKIFQQQSGRGKDSAGKPVEARRSTSACRAAASRMCAYGSCSSMPAAPHVPLSSGPLPAPLCGRHCVARERRLHHIIRGGMRRDGWLVFHTFWYDVLAECASPDSPQTWPGCLLGAVQDSVTTRVASREESSADESVRHAPLRTTDAPRARVKQRDIGSRGVWVDTEADASPLGVLVHETRWDVDTSDEDDEWRESEKEGDGTVALHVEHGSSQWCCCCLASHEHLIHGIMEQVEGPAATTKQRVAVAPTLGCSELCPRGGARPPLCPAWWRTGSTAAATTASEAPSTSQRNPTIAAARATTCQQSVRRACRRPFPHALDAGDVSVPPARVPRSLSVSALSLPSLIDGCTHGTGREGTLDGEIDGDRSASGAAARSFFARLRRYAAQLLSCDTAAAARSAAAETVTAATAVSQDRCPSSCSLFSSFLGSTRCCSSCCGIAVPLSAPPLRSFSPRLAMVGASTPSGRQQQEEDDDIEVQVAPLRRYRYTRHVCTFAEEAKSLQTWLLPRWWANQQQRFAGFIKPPPPPLLRSRISRCLGHPLDRSRAMATTAACKGVGKGGDSAEDTYQSSLRCFLDRHDETEAWVQLLHYAHLRLLRRPYGPLFRGKCLLRCAPLDGCVADAEVHHTYLAAMLHQRTEELAEC
ncbi:hypothetical protein, conserved [Leishmania lindenbergi]|uniref:Uncharacterized protein n=1 Tax=Leishmania lindenbergi TaxID=651832 RepID=A0AAW3AUS8_9TRYP